MAQTLPYQPIIRSDPKFQKSLTADFTFQWDCEKTRRRPFLLRNIRRLLSHHERLLRLSVEPNIRGLSPDSSQSGCLRPESSSASQQPFAASVDAFDLAQHLDVKAASTLPESVPESLLKRSLAIRTMDNKVEAVSRRSTRKLQELVYDHDTAELSINLCSIRKLLNFTSNRPSDGARPRKQVKRDQVKCQCSLTIWDNRPEVIDREAIVKKNAFCTLIVVDNEPYGPCVYVDLDKPFIVKAGDLKVPVDRKNESGLEIIDNYFMEFKIIPTRSDVDWPPIPILGKSDGDHYSRLSRLASEALAGALVMKYKEIPKAPDPSTPLKAFFLHSGMTFKTKYGLEVSAEWIRRSRSTDLLDAQLGVEYGEDHIAPKETELGQKSSKSKERTQALVPQDDMSLVESVKRRRRKVKVIYQFEPNTSRSQEVPQMYRTAEISGLVCPVCLPFKARDLQELRFHFLSSHPKYNFALGQTIEDEQSEELREVVFDVIPVPLPKPTSRLIKDEKEFEWFAKATPFDLAAFLDGDTSWLAAVGEESRPVLRRALPPVVSSTILASDPATGRRLQNQGFLPAEEVRDFRQPNRNKHPVIKLIRQIDDKVATYNSVSHREISASEEPLSETDDECDDEWFIQRHLENLEIAAKQEGWHPMKRELFRRWDRHRLEEKLEHTRFISDSLVRFVRKEKKWLANSGGALDTAFEQILEELTRSRFINAQVSTDVRKLISDAKEPVVNPPEDYTATETRKFNLSGHEEAKSTEDMVADLASLGATSVELVHSVFQAMHDAGAIDPRRNPSSSPNFELRAMGMISSDIDTELRKWSPDTENPEGFQQGDDSGIPLRPKAVGRSIQAPPPGQSLSDVIETVAKALHLAPQEQLASWRAEVRARPAGHCPECAEPILRRIDEGIHCSSPACPTSSVWFHTKCVKLKNRRPDWICRGCKAEARLKGEQEKATKGKGKERAVD